LVPRKPRALAPADEEKGVKPPLTPEALEFSRGAAHNSLKFVPDI